MKLCFHKKGAKSLWFLLRAGKLLRIALKVAETVMAVGK